MVRRHDVRPIPERAFFEATQEYHAVAKPLLKPIKKSRFGMPRVLQQPERAVSQLGPLLGGLHPVVPDNGYQNFLAAFRKRCNYHSAERASSNVISGSCSLINLLCPETLPEFNWDHHLFEPWLQRFGAEKQARMVAAVEKLSTLSLNEYSSKEIFVKVEALLVAHKPNWAPRVIYKGSDLYNAISGPMFCELMARLDGCTTRMKGGFECRLAYKRLATQYTPFLANSSGSYVESDFSANDMKQCSDVLLLELMLMRRLGCPEWFIRLHSKTNQFQVKSREHRVKATLENQLPTGVTDTTFRNCFWNMAILYSFCLKTRVARCRAVILGDDMLAKIAGLSRYAVRTYENIAKEAQMDAKVFRREHLVDCTFLSKLFVPRSNGGHLTVPLLGKALGRFNMRANRNSAVTDHAYMAGKAVGYAYEFRYVPHLRDVFMQRFLFEWDFCLDEKRRFDEGGLQDGLSWNARQSGITLKNIKSKLVVPEVLLDTDWMAFCYTRYHLTSTEVNELFERMVLDVDGLDDLSIVGSLLSVDFLGA